MDPMTLHKGETLRREKNRSRSNQWRQPLLVPHTPRSYPWSRWAAAIALLLVSVRAEATGKRIGVPEFEGAQEALVRKQVMQSLKAHGFAPVGSRDMQEAILLNGASLDSEDDMKRLANELTLSAIVTGEVGPRRAKIVVHDGAGGSVLGEASFGGANPRKLADEVGLTFWQKLGPAVGRGHLPLGVKGAPKMSREAGREADENGLGSEVSAGDYNGKAGARKPKNDSGSAEGGESDETPPPPKKGKKKARFRMEEAPPEEAPGPSVPSANPWLEFALGVGGLNRSLTFNQNVVVQGSALLRPYTLGFGPIGVANMVAYPWVAGRVGNLGLEAEIQQGLGISSTLSTGGSFSDTVHEYAGGLRYRVMFATTDDVFFSLAFGEDAFTFNGPNRMSLATPDTVYHYTRVGMGMHVTISEGIAVSFGAGYRYITNSAGAQISQDVFPHLTVAGADADMVAHYALSEMFELRAGLEWRRYWYDMHSLRGDTVVAGGAVDQSFAFTAGVAVLLGVSSVPKAGGGAEEAPTPPPSPKRDARRRKKPSDDDESSGEDSDPGERRPSVDADSGRKSAGDTDE